MRIVFLLLISFLSSITLSASKFESNKQTAYEFHKSMTADNSFKDRRYFEYQPPKLAPQIENNRMHMKDTIDNIRPDVPKYDFVKDETIPPQVEPGYVPNYQHEFVVPDIKMYRPDMKRPVFNFERPKFVRPDFSVRPEFIKPEFKKMEYRLNEYEYYSPPGSDVQYFGNDRFQEIVGSNDGYFKGITDERDRSFGEIQRMEAKPEYRDYSYLGQDLYDKYRNHASDMQKKSNY